MGAVGPRASPETGHPLDSDKANERHERRITTISRFGGAVDQACSRARLRKSLEISPLAIGFMVLTTSIVQDTQVYLLEDALDLWAAILIQTPDSAAGDVLPLAPYLFHLYELGSEHLRKAFEITESYIVLAPSQMLDTQIRSQMLPALASLLGSLKSEANGVISHIVDTVIREADMVGGVQAATFIATQLADCGLLFKVVDGLRGNWEANQTTGPKKKASSVAGVIETDYFCIISRLALADPRGLCTVLQTVAAVYGEDVGQTMSWLVDEWFSHFGNIGHPTHRKLSCLGLTNMLQTAAPWILGRLQDLMTVWTDVITEVQEGSDTTGTEYVSSVLPVGERLGQLTSYLQQSCVSRLARSSAHRTGTARGQASANGAKSSLTYKGCYRLSSADLFRSLASPTPCAASTRRTLSGTSCSRALRHVADRSLFRTTGSRTWTRTSSATLGSSASCEVQVGCEGSKVGGMGSERSSSESLK